jgi:hypothetical protein
MDPIALLAASQFGGVAHRSGKEAEDAFYRLNDRKPLGLLPIVSAVAVIGVTVAVGGLLH